MKHHSLSKVLKRLACVLAALVIALAVAVFALWHNELATLSSLKKLSDRNEAHRDGAVYQLNVSGGYYFDDFLARGGASTDSELISFITQSITKGIIPMNIKTSTIACSAFTADTQSGDRVFGRNYDFSATNTAIVYTNPGKGRHASYSTIDLSFLGLDKDKDVESLGQKILTLAAPYVPLDGVNDAGVACGIFMSYQGEGKGTPPIPRPTSPTSPPPPCSGSSSTTPTRWRTPWRWPSSTTFTTRQAAASTTWWPTPPAAALSSSGWVLMPTTTPTALSVS